MNKSLPSVIVIYNTRSPIRRTTIFIRIEPSSSTPIYRQVADQIRYLVATGVLKQAEKVLSVRELANQLAVNQNTILKVYNELCREGVLEILRGEGTFVSSNKQKLSKSHRISIIADSISEAAVLAVQLKVDLKEVQKMLEDKYNEITSQRDSDSHKKEDA